MRNLLSPALFSVTAASVLLFASGCGSSHAPLQEVTGSGPVPPPGTPFITSLDPTSVTAGGPGFTLTVKGENFASDDTVEFDSTLLNSTFISSTEMQAQVPASATWRPETASIIVVTPTPAALNFGSTLTVLSPLPPGDTGFTVSSIGIEANDLAWDPVSQQIYLSVENANSVDGGTITALNPIDAQLGASQLADAEPDKLAVSSDGSYLYAGIDSKGEVERFTLPDLDPDLDIPLGTFMNGNVSEPYSAMDIEAAPGSPHTIAAATGAKVTIFDDATPRALSAPWTGAGPALPGSGEEIVWNAAGTDLFGLETNYSANQFYVFSVDSQGIQVQSDFPEDGTAGVTLVSGGLHYSATTGYVYTDGGQVVDPEAGAVVGVFPLDAIAIGILGGAMALDSSLNIAYFVGDTILAGNTTEECVIEAFDLKTFVLLGSIEIPNVSGAPFKLIRWGSNGLAFLTSANSDSPVAKGSEDLYLVQGDFVQNPTVQ